MAIGPASALTGAQLNHAIDYVLSCQMPDGLFSHEPIEPMLRNGGTSHTGSYNHAIAGLMLGEVFGHVTGARSKAVKKAVQKSPRIHPRPPDPAQKI